jgi:hypothetical protein
MLQDMITALVLAAICIQAGQQSICLNESVVANVGEQLLSRVVPDSREREQAAFLTLNHDGNLGCRLWPFTTERASSTYRGVVPEGTFAIIHTHPHELVFPSRGDGAVSARLGMPVLVITHGWISIVDPARHQERWIRRPDRGTATPTCALIEPELYGDAGGR